MASINFRISGCRVVRSLRSAFNAKGFALFPFKLYSKTETGLPSSYQLLNYLNGDKAKKEIPVSWHHKDGSASQFVEASSLVRMEDLIQIFAQAKRQPPSPSCEDNPFRSTASEGITSNLGNKSRNHVPEQLFTPFFSLFKLLAEPLLLL